MFIDACSQCHGEAGRGNITSGKKLEDDWGNRIWPRDLTKPETWRATSFSQSEPADKAKAIAKIYQRLSIGIPGTPMPSHRAVEQANEDPISLEDRWHVANFVYSLRDTHVAVGKQSVITGVKIETPLPDEADDQLWQQAQPVSLRLVPNVIKGDRLFTPLNDSITVRAIYNDDEIAFLLELNDRTDSRPGEAVSAGIQDQRLEFHADAFAVQFPKADAFTSKPLVEKPLYRHGDKAHPTTIWYWNAGRVEPPVAAMSQLFDAAGPDSPVKPRSDSSSLSAHGAWHEGRWQVVMKHPRVAADKADVEFREGNFIPVSFANWDGSNGEIGSKHSFTSWYWLLLPTEVDLRKTYGLPLAIALTLFMLGLLLLRKNSQKATKP